MAKDKRFVIVVGGKHSGKSHWIDEVTKGKRLCVYNAGSKGEFADCKIVKFPDPRIKRQRIYKEFNKKKEREIALGMFKNCSGNIVIDDSLSIFRHGVSAEFGYLLSKTTHTKNGKGANMFVVFHNFGQINSTVLDYASDFVIFNNPTSRVDFRVDLGEDITNRINIAVSKLKKAKKYSRVHINLE